MQRIKTKKLCLYLSTFTTFLPRFSAVSPFPKRLPYLGFSKDFKGRFPFMSGSRNLVSVGKEVTRQYTVQQLEVLNGVEDLYGGIRVDIKDPMDSEVFVSLLRNSMSKWREEGKKGVWVKIPIEHVNLVEPAVKQGFVYHHAEPNFLMLVCWIPETANTLPENASHRVGIGAFVMNSEREVLVVQENGGPFKGTGVWKFPTGVVNEGEDICTAAIREVKEETGIEAEFVEVLAFRQSHKSFFSKSDLFFVCILQPRSSVIEKQHSEIESAKWMPIKEYAAQPFIREHAIFNNVAKICLAKSNKGYAGFSPLATSTTSGKPSYLYFNNQALNLL